MTTIPTHVRYFRGGKGPSRKNWRTGGVTEDIESSSQLCPCKLPVIVKLYKFIVIVSSGFTKFCLAPPRVGLISPLSVDTHWCTWGSGRPRSMSVLPSLPAPTTASVLAFLLLTCSHHSSPCPEVPGSTQYAFLSPS